jgi:hypothetical protein
MVYNIYTFYTSEWNHKVCLTNMLWTHSFIKYDLSTWMCDVPQDLGSFDTNYIIEIFKKRKFSKKKHLWTISFGHGIFKFLLIIGWTHVEANNVGLDHHESCFGFIVESDEQNLFQTQTLLNLTIACNLFIPL